MEHKNNTVLLVVVGLVGLLVGWLIWGSAKPAPLEHPTGMVSMMAQMNASLQGKSGDEFDKAFISEMILHHQGAIDMAKLALTSAGHQEIKTLANAIVAAQTKEIGEMKVWYKAWYGTEVSAPATSNENPRTVGH